MQLYYATCSNLFAIYSLRGRSKYSINTCFVSSLLNLFVSRRTHRYIIILGQHHRFPSYFCGLRACSLARSLAKDFIASFVQYHFMIVVPPASSPRFHSSSFLLHPALRPRLVGLSQLVRRYSLAFCSDDINAGLAASR